MFRATGWKIAPNFSPAGYAIVVDDTHEHGGSITHATEGCSNRGFYGCTKDKCLERANGEMLAVHVSADCQGELRFR